MKITNTSIVIAETAIEAIKLAISEHYNEEAAKKAISLLSVNGCVGTCVTTNAGGTYIHIQTSYFIVTDISPTMKRVEFCSESSMTDK